MAFVPALGGGSPTPKKAASYAGVGRNGSLPRSRNTSGTSNLDDQIANDIGMPRQNVAHYMRFRDQMKVAAGGQKRLRLVSGED
jgi:hypothetical protein